MKRLILLLIIVTGAVIGYSQDTIVTVKKMHIGEILLVGDDYFCIKTEKNVHDIVFKNIVLLKTSNQRANEKFDIFKASNKYTLAHIPSPVFKKTIKDEFSDEYNCALRTFNKFNAQRKGGKAAMIGGGIATVAGGIMAGMGGSGLAIAGIVVSSAGGVSFLVGLFCWIDGQDKMFNAKNELNIIKLKRSSISTDGAKISLNF